MGGSSPATGTLELPALGADTGSSVGAVLTGVETEVTLGLAVAGTPQQQHVLPVGSLLGQLVEGEGGAFGGMDALLGGGGELEGADAEAFGDVEEADVVGDGADHGDGAPVELALALGGLGAVVGEVFDDAGDGEGVAVKARLVEPLVDDLVELALSASLHEGVKLGEERGTLMRLLR